MAPQPVFAARLTPNRSLSDRGAALVLLLTGLATAALSLPFVILGAWPVAGFLGLDVLLLWLAFRMYRRHATAYEVITVEPSVLRVTNVSAAGRAAEARFHPFWARIRRDEHEEFGVERLTINEGRRSVEIARHLGRGEKADFARALEDGIRRANAAD